MSGQINVHDSELRAHADKLLDVADELHSTSTTAAGINLHNGAFGVMMAWLPGVINKLTPSNSGAISAGGDAVQRTSEGVKDLADDFRGTDEYLASQLDKIRG